MERMTAVQVRLLMLERTLSMLIKSSPHADLFLQMLEELAAELAPSGVPPECFQMRDALRSISIGGAPASEAPEHPASPAPP